MLSAQDKHETCTPFNIASLSEEEIISIAKEVSDARVPMKARLAVLKKVYELLSYNLSNDLLLALLADVKQQLILACAGGCKTTSSQVIIILAKIFWNRLYGRHLTSSEVLCLVYNRENRPQMDKKHAELLTPLVMSGFLSHNPEDSNYVNVGITSHTLHSFCKHWIEHYRSQLGIENYNIANDGDVTIFLMSAIKHQKRNSAGGDSNIKFERVQTLYDLLHGLCLTYEDLSEENPLLSDAICSCNATVEQLTSIFKSYDAQKKFFRVFDFTDMLLLMNKLLDDPEVKNRMHLLYSFVVVDEIQDFTPLMMTILKKLIGPESKLLAIGDEDQSIYGFRGADVNNAMRFKEHFPGSKIFQLLVNRRCGNNILDSAAKVIEINKNRYDKDLIAENRGGDVTFTEYDGLEKQLSNIAGSLVGMDRGSLNSVVVCAREKVYGQPITYALFRNRIPFHLLNAHSFHYHEAFRGFLEVMSLLWKPTRDNWRNLYKITNIKKSDWFGYIKFNEKKQSVEGFPDKSSLWELDFEPFTHYAGLVPALKELHRIHRGINSFFCKDYIKYIIKLFKQNFWETRVGLEPIAFSVEVFDWISGVFEKTAPYPVLFEEYSEFLRRMGADQKYRTGVTVATMHALKGLEYDTVHMAFMEDAIFPAYCSIDVRGYPSDVSTALKEAENRLAYVAMTRAKNHLHIHYNVADPSFYVKLLRDSPTQPDATQQLVFSNRKKW